jgi:hypothetical protein
VEALPGHGLIRCGVRLALGRITRLRVHEAHAGRTHLRALLHHMADFMGDQVIARARSGAEHARRERNVIANGRGLGGSALR